MNKIYGPYTSRSDRRKMIVVDLGNKKKTTTLYSRFLMEQKLGRKLLYDETVDHIDEDPTNDEIDNLQVVSRSENSKKSFILRGTPAEMIEITCLLCGKKAIKEARNIRANKKKNKRGPYCGRSCAGKDSHNIPQ